MSATSPAAGTRFPRRTLLAVSAAGVAVLAAGCTSAPAPARPPVTDKQAQALAAQVKVQDALVAAYATAGAADPAVRSAVADLATDAATQLKALQAAAPSTSSSHPSPPPSPAPATPRGDARAWLRGQVAATATSHATACLDQSGARAALLGSIAAGLRGQDRRLA